MEDQSEMRRIQIYDEAFKKKVIDEYLAGGSLQTAGVDPRRAEAYRFNIFCILYVTDNTDLLFIDNIWLPK